MKSNSGNRQVTSSGRATGLQIARRSAGGKPRGKERKLSVHSILVPIDFSECSKKALSYAAAFADQFGGELTVLHVVRPYIPVPEATMIDVGMIERSMRETAEFQLKELQTELGGKRRIRTLIYSGNPAIEVVKAAKSLGSDLIIISTHGRTGMGHWLIGSTAEKVVRHAGCPVLVVRERERDCLSQPKQKAATARPTTNQK